MEVIVNTTTFRGVGSSVIHYYETLGITGIEYVERYDKIGQMPDMNDIHLINLK